MYLNLFFSTIMTMEVEGIDGTIMCLAGEMDISMEVTIGDCDSNVNLPQTLTSSSIVALNYIL